MRKVQKPGRQRRFFACVAGHFGNFEQGYIAMGYIIIASSVFTIFMRIKGQSSVLCGDQ